MSAPMLDVVETVNAPAPAVAPLPIAASKSNAPVIPIVPSVPLVPVPTAASNCTSELPTLKVKLFASLASEFTVPLKVICELVVVNVVAAPIVMVSDVASPYVCVEEVVIVLVLIVVFPVTSNTATPVTVSAVPLPKTALPVTVKLFVPPATVPLVVTVVPVKSTFALKVTAPE